MKKLLYLFLVLGLMMLTAGCTHTSREPRLVAVDSMLATRPDSALALLNRFDTTTASQADCMYYQLLRYKTDDQLDKLSATTEDAERLVDYFEDDGDKRLLPMAYYYGGRICVENNNVPQALAYFHKAEKFLINGDNDVLLSKVYSQTGYLFVKRRMYDEARHYFEKSYETDKAIQDTIGMIYNLRDIGVSYCWSGMENESLPFFYDAKSLAYTSKDDIMRHDIEMSLAQTYHKLGVTDSAKYYTRLIMKEMTEVDCSPILSIASQVYYNDNKIDSTIAILKELLVCGTRPAQCNAYEMLMNICIHQNRNTDAAIYYLKYRALRDSLDVIYSTEEIAQANAAYNYQVKETENYQLKIKNNRQRFTLIIITCVTLFLLLFASLYFNQYKNKQKERLKELERLKNEQYLQSEKYIEENRRRIAELEEQLQQADLLSKDLQIELEREKDRLASFNEIAILKNLESKRSLNIIRTSPVFRNMIEMAEKNTPQNISDNQWVEFEALINQEYKGFSQRLTELCNLSQTELRVCLLIKSHVEPSLIATIIIRAKNTVTSIRSRLFYKVFGQEGTAKDWDEVIYAL